MIKKIAETIVGGAIGAAALYAVGRMAYQAGQKVAREECRYNALRRANARLADKEEAPPFTPDEIASEKKQSRLSLLFGAGKLLGNRKSVIGNLVQNPEDHKFEAFVEGDELRIYVKRREKP